MSHNITVSGGTSVRLPTAGKYCDRDIVITAEGDGGYERGYADGYGKGETAAKAEAEAHNEEILTDCNAVLPTKGVETADTLEQVPQRIGEIQSYSDGYNVGLEDGKKSEYDRFWDACQENGKRTNYGLAFAGAGWTDEIFSPKHLIKPTVAEQTFFRSMLTTIPDGILDLSNVTDGYQTFREGAFVTLPRIDISNCSEGTIFLFAYCSNLKQIKTLVVSERTTFVTNSFHTTPSLEDIEIEGTIAKTITLQWSPLLTNASMQSIIDHLADLTGATAQTLTLHATVGNKLTEAQKATITAKNWTLVY
jgi:hypothetical protein